MQGENTEDSTRGTASALSQVDHLLLLVGSNPLPNAVAARLLAKQDTYIHLVGSQGLHDVTKRLRCWLENNKYKNVSLTGEVDEYDPRSIFCAVSAALATIQDGVVGLNYTGGTKAMAVHAYRAVLDWWQPRQSKGCARPIFTYLDPHGPAMVRDPEDPKGGGTLEKREVLLLPHSKMTLKDDVLTLHGWQYNGPTTEPILPKSAHKLADVYANGNGDAWETWIVDELRYRAKRERGKKRSEDRFRCPNAREGIEACYQRPFWKPNNQLKPIKLVWPSDPKLSEVVKTLGEELALENMPCFTLGAGKITTLFNEVQDFCKWLEGRWLESLALKAFQDNASCLSLHDCAMNLNPTLKDKPATHFELDAVAIRGYRLFACSCSADQSNPRLKTKLFEVYHRARQIGGDEARVALVCCSGDPHGIEDEAPRDLDVQAKIKPVKVFGREHLSKLGRHVKDWIQNA
ncbi:MAG: hypothetical protein ACREA0_01405 [bacterium]